MANIGDVYGKDFQQRACLDKAVHASSIYAQNIAHKQFNFRNNSSEMWDGNNIKPEIIRSLCEQVRSGNKYMELVHIPKTAGLVNMFPYLINGAVEYFLAVDTEHSAQKKTPVYSIYITPSYMSAY